MRRKQGFIFQSEICVILTFHYAMLLFLEAKKCSVCFCMHRSSHDIVQDVLCGQSLQLVGYCSNNKNIGITVARGGDCRHESTRATKETLVG